MMEQGGADRGGHRQAEQQDECGDDQEAVADGEQAGEEPDGESGADGLGQAAGPVDLAALQGAVSADGHLLAQHPVPAPIISGANPISTTRGRAAG